SWLGTEAWKAYGSLAGSWIGGTGNMIAVSKMIDADGADVGLAIVADTTIYLIWLPILLASKHLDERFARFARVDAEQLAKLRSMHRTTPAPQQVAQTHHLIALLCLGFAATWLADSFAAALPEQRPYLTSSTWRILLLTSFGIALSFTPLRKIPGSHPLAMALLYLFVAKMGASADLQQAATQAAPFVVGALICIVVHGAFCLAGARLFRVDVHTAAIASAANIGGAASAPIVAGHHDPQLAPAGVLMALVGYAVGNYAGWLAALLCRWTAGL
ncbi:MAG: DUF819 family protein, partial [Planctomycetales bacterium]|nr:DUF819 family protein [Planctomycetales bacterium]